MELQVISMEFGRIEPLAGRYGKVMFKAEATVREGENPEEVLSRLKAFVQAGLDKAIEEASN